MTPRSRARRLKPGAATAFVVIMLTAALAAAALLWAELQNASSPALTVARLLVTSRVILLVATVESGGVLLALALTMRARSSGGATGASEATGEAAGASASATAAAPGDADTHVPEQPESADSPEDDDRDSLTGLHNGARLQREIVRDADRAAATGDALACLMVEIDHYGAYRKTQGSGASELLLAEVADLLRDAVRASDSAYRCGESTFVLTLPGTGAAAARRLAERLRESVARALLTEGVTASIGLAGIPTSACDAIDLLDAAESALEDAKRHGRNQVRQANVTVDELTAARQNASGE